ncbi:alpha/beta fold hydrolase, partial [uncultured Varibaculum sp.]|uniref:alpha/beta fold hydrolase n=1 Tax=uncultured Varibaculum sp. TaxID=413896 RepID=UPI00259306C4
RFDNRDVGRSSPTPYPYDLRDMAADVAALIRFYGSPATVTGRSMGGAIAQLLALDFPQLVSGLGLFFTYAKNSSQLVKPVRKAPFSNRDQFLAWHFRQITEIAGSKYPWKEKRLHDLVTRCWQRGFSWKGTERQRQAMERTAPWAQRLGEIQVPVSIVHGEEDPVIPAAAGQELHRLIQHSQLHLVPGMGHQQPLEVNDLFLKATLEAAGIPAASS